MAAERLFLGLGGLLGGLAVALGAFAAHGLRSRLASDLLSTFETGVRYQMYHALALLLVAMLLTRGMSSGLLTAAGWLFVAGAILFSGSLYGLTLGGLRWLGMVTPLGGLAFILGWLCVLLAAWRG